MRLLSSLLRGLLVVGLVSGAYVAYKRAFGQPVGGPCGDSSDCAQLIGAQCLYDPTGNYCTSVCRADGECPGGWRCVRARSPRGELLPEGACSRVGQPSAPRGRARAGSATKTR